MYEMVDVFWDLDYSLSCVWYNETGEVIGVLMVFCY